MSQANHYGVELQLNVISQAQTRNLSEEMVLRQKQNKIERATQKATQNFLALVSQSNSWEKDWLSSRDFSIASPKALKSS
jgi:hypothetical protein